MGLGRLGLHYFSDQDVKALGTDWVLFDLKFESISMFITNDEADGTDNWIEWSFDGVNVHGRLLPQEWRVMDDLQFQKVWVRAKVAGYKYRLESY